MSQRKATPDWLTPEAGRSGDPSTGWSGRRLGDVELDLDLRAAWRREDPELVRDAIAFWERLAILPPDVTPEDRARELAAGAYRDGRLVGVTTATISSYPPLRAKFAFMRVAVGPEERRSLASTALTVFTRDIVEQWSADHPEERVLGLAAIIESEDLRQRQRDPVWENTRLNLVSFLRDGRQIRVAWFAHARYE